MWENGELITHNRKVQGHVCSLPEDEDVIVRYIHDGFFVELRRRIKKLLMVSASNRETKAVLKSTAQIRLEEAKHLNHFYYMIHPFSAGRTFWETLMIPVYLLMLVLIPVQICSDENHNVIMYLKFALIVISWMDIVLWFFTGYHDVEKQKIVMDQQRVIKRYVFGYFLSDLLSSIPVFMVLEYLNKQEKWGYKLILALRLFRIGTMLTYLRKLFERMDFWSYRLRLANLVFGYFILLWWASCIVFLVSVKANPQIYDGSLTSFMLVMVECAHQVVMKFMLVGLGTLPTSKDEDVAFQLFCLFFGCVLSLIMMAQVMQIYNRHTSARNKYNSLTQQIGEYMKYKELPARLKEKVFQFVDFKFQKHIYKEADILNTLSTLLKQDILLHNCKSLVERVDFFRDLPTSLILRIVTKLRPEIYMPNDVIVQAGIAGHSMYFIYMGTVSVYTSTGKEICHLQDGSYFGEIALVIHEPRVASVVAVKECEVFRLNRKDFQEAIEPYPELSNRIRVSALSRLETTMKLMDDRDDDTADELVDIESLQSFTTE